MKKIDHWVDDAEIDVEFHCPDCKLWNCCSMQKNIDKKDHECTECHKQFVVRYNKGEGSVYAVSEDQSRGVKQI